MIQHAKSQAIFQLEINVSVQSPSQATKASSSSAMLSEVALSG